MKLLILILSLVSMASASSATVNWNSQEINRTYKLNKTIKLQHDDGFITIPTNTYFELYEITELSMIKVHLHKYNISNCPSQSMETDLELIQVKQPGNSTTSVGVNLTKGCKVEIFIDMNEYQTNSFFN